MTVVSQILRHPANKDSRYRSLAFALYWQGFKRLTGRSLDINYHGFKLRCYPNSHSASRAIYFSGLPDYWEMRFMEDYLREGDYFIDCGANAGLYTLLASSKVGRSGFVDAFEPNQEVAKRLYEIIELNSLENIAIHQVGLAEKPDRVALILTGDDSTSYIGAESDNKQDTEISVTRLDKQLENRPYAMAKFDIEGYEPFALRGASTWLADNNPPVMLIEMGGLSNRHGITTSDFVDELDSIGYFTAVYCPETRTLTKTNKHWEIPEENVLAIAKDREESVEQRLRDK